MKAVARKSLVELQDLENNPGSARGSFHVHLQEALRFYSQQAKARKDI
jgi:hypothetical protein